MKALLLAAAALAAVVASSPSHAQDGPSFNCRYAKASDEVAICQSALLSKLDREMAQLHFSRLGWEYYSSADKRELRAEQRRWLNTSACLRLRFQMYQEHLRRADSRVERVCRRVRQITPKPYRKSLLIDSKIVPRTPAHPECAPDRGYVYPFTDSLTFH